jgi:hypothetical protein
MSRVFWTVAKLENQIRKLSKWEYFLRFNEMDCLLNFGKLRKERWGINNSARDQTKVSESSK